MKRTGPLRNQVLQNSNKTRNGENTSALTKESIPRRNNRACSPKSTVSRLYFFFTLGGVIAVKRGQHANSQPIQGHSEEEDCLCGVLTGYQNEIPIASRQASVTNSPLAWAAFWKDIICLYEFVNDLLWTVRSS